MNYTLHHLQVFLKVTQLKSITKASEELFLTQPAVSIQLKNFQDQFEIPLTEIIGRKLYVTDFGNEIAHAAENILNEVYAINYKTMVYKGQLSGRLKIAIVSTAKYIMPFFLTDYMKINDAIDFQLDVTNKSKVIESLEKNEIDFAMVSVLPAHLQIEKMDLMPSKLYLIGNSAALVNKKTASKDIFEDLPLIYRENGSGTRFVMEQFIKTNNIIVRKKMELTSNEAVKQAVLAGLGYSIMPIIGIKNELLNGELHIIPVEKFPLVSNWYLIWLKNKKFSPLASNYLKFIEKHKQQIIKNNFAWVEKY